MTEITPTPAPAPSPAPAPAPGPAPSPAPAPGPDPSPTPAPAPDPNGTILGGKPGDAPAPAPAGDWPADWREKVAGDDKGFLERLKRMGSPMDLAKSYREIDLKQSQGLLKGKLPDNANDDQKAAFRVENGLPDKPDVYVEALELPNGMVIGEADKPIVGELAKVAHEAMMPTAAFNGLVAKYYELQAAQQQQLVEADKTFHNESISALGGEWGAEYKTNVNVVNGFIGKFFPEEIASDVLVARMPDGRMLGDHPAFIKTLRQLAHEVDPVGALVPAGGGNSAKLAEDRIAEIKGWMGSPAGSDNHKKYWGDEKVRSEYRNLLDAQAKMKGRAA